MAANRKNVVVTGHKELDATLATVEPKIQKKVVRKGLREAGKLIQAAAKGNLGRNGNVESGELQKGIRVRAMKRSRSRIGVQVVTTERKVADKSGNRFGGGQLEVGSKRQRAQPFLRPAGYDNKDSITQKVVASVKSVLAELAR